MNAHLMYRDCDFDARRPLPSHEAALVQDLDLQALIEAMTAGDEFIAAVVKQALLARPDGGVETIRYRQAVLQDCLRHRAVVTEMYDTVVAAMESKRRQWWSLSSRHPSSVLHGAIELLRLFLDPLATLKRIADAQAAAFSSDGFRTLFATLAAELSDDYLAGIRRHLDALAFRHGVLVTAELGLGNEGINYILREAPPRETGFIRSLLARKPAAYTLRIDDRDEAGARALADMRDRGVNLVANALAQAADHVLSFFDLLRTELAFYVGCANLHDALSAGGAPIAFPDPSPPGTGRMSAAALYDPCLALRLGRRPVASDCAADGARLVVITGANQGGKSTFLRSVGLAHVMMQAGLFVAADAFAADLRPALFTHYMREEDAAMKSGKFDEELSRMSAIVDAIEPHALVLLNESFSATNEREGSEIARQIVGALVDAGITVVFVTHLSDFASSAFHQARSDVVFLRADRQPDGQRTFKIVPGEPLETSFGADVYDQVFGADAHASGTGEPPAADAAPSPAGTSESA